METILLAPAGQEAARFSQPEGPGIFPPVPATSASAVPQGTTLAHRLDPDENLLRQNVSI